MKPRALDLFCGAGGATKGMQRAGFHVTGVDIFCQPRYCGDAFVQADALMPPFDLARQFDFIWASPLCQAYVKFRMLTRGPRKDHPRLIEPTRELLKASGVPYAIENVEGAPLENPSKLCGSHFGLGVRRHRLFETSFMMLVPPCQCRLRGMPRPIAVYGDHPQTPQDNTYRCNRARSLLAGQEAMGIDWMDWKSLTQSIPPVYAEFVGRVAIEQIRLMPGLF